MINSYAVYDQFLDNPLQVVESLRSQKYYVQGLPENQETISNNIPLEINYDDDGVVGDPRFGSPYWKGYRTRDLQDIDMGSYNTIMSKLLDKMFGSFSLSQIEFDAETHFHLMTEDFVPNDTWFHTDGSKFIAGVLYLSQNPQPNSGTYLVINNERVCIENVYNRLIVYNANLVHSAAGCFGNSIENCRATFVFFIRNILLYNDVIEKQENDVLDHMRNQIGGY